VHTKSFEIQSKYQLFSCFTAARLCSSKTWILYNHSSTSLETSSKSPSYLRGHVVISQSECLRYCKFL